MSIKHSVTTDLTEPKTVFMSDMPDGAIGVCQYGGSDHVVVSAYDRRVVSLTEPHHIWFFAGPGFGVQVRLLPPGTKISLTVGA